MSTHYEVKYFVKKCASNTWRLEDSSIQYYDLTFILAGDASYISGGQSYSLKAGEAIFLPMGSDRYAQTNGMECVAFNFHSDDVPLFPGVTKIVWNCESTLHSYFFEFDQAWISKSKIDTLRCQGLFLIIISRLLELQQLKQCNPYISKIKHYIHKHYTEKITVQMVADNVNLSSVYCGALFSKEMGETILHYTNRLRILKAKELLNYTNTSITEIASDVGLEELYYFSRIFKKIVGISPQQYRSRLFEELK